MNSKLRMVLALLSPAVLVSQAGCVMPEGVEVSNSAIEVVPNPTPTTSNAICNPLDSSGPTLGSSYGLVANLWYAPDGQRNFNQVKDFQTNGIKLDATLFFNQLNVPTRAFDLGFATQDGTILKTPNGDTLYEYFALHFDSVLKLSFRDQPGRYQFALLADDGAVLHVNDDGHGFRVLVDDDGTHPTQMACASEGLDLDYTTRLPIQVDYYQGPRYHIALMLLWRKLPDGAECFHDDACGASGNDAFFDSTQVPSAPEQRYLDMLARGWKVVTPENYTLPASSGVNPCTTPSVKPTPTPSPSPTSPIATS